MTKTVQDSSSSAAGRLEVDLTADGRLAPLPQAFLAGRDRQLLDPLRFVCAPRDLPAEPPRLDRRAIAATLEAANRRLGHPRATELAAGLARPGARVVVTGQQPGLLGGPLYTLTKALAAVRWAQELEGGVPVFWVASEDHDWAEVSRVTLASSRDLETFDLGDDPAPLAPVGPRVFGNEIETFWARTEPLFASSPEVLARLREHYAPGRCLGEAFCRTLIDWLGDDCPLLLDALDPGIKELERPLLEEIIERRQEITAAYELRDQEIAAAGYEHKVRPQEDASPLFMLDNGARRRILWPDAEHYELRGGEPSAAQPTPVSDLLARLTDEPGLISPGALARPWVQDRLLGSSVVLLGPGEMSYFPQAAALYAALGPTQPGGAYPAVALRPQSLLISTQQVERLGSLDLTLEELFAPDFDVDQWVARSAEEDPIPAVRAALEEILAPLGRRALEIDAMLERPWSKTLSQIDRGLDAFGKKLTAAVARDHDVERRRVMDLERTALPLGKPQERVLAGAYFAARYGPDFAARWLAALDLDPSALRAVVL